MNKYELAVVVSAKIENDERAAVIEKVKDTHYNKFGGNITNVDEWGQEETCIRSSEDERSLLLLHSVRRCFNSSS